MMGGLALALARYAGGMQFRVQGSNPKHEAGQLLVMQKEPVDVTHQSTWVTPDQW
jgi:hypothetical protein